MKLRTRILFLFASTMVVMAVLVMAHYVHQSIILEHFEDSLEGLRDAMNPLLMQGDFLSLDAVFATWEMRVREAGLDFEEYRSRVYLQTVISAVLLMVLFAVGMTSLKKHVLHRLSIMRRFVVDAFQHGWAHRRLHMPGTDELSQFSKLFNTSMDTIEANMQSYTGKLAEDRKIITTLISGRGIPQAYFRSNGDFLGSGLGEKEEQEIMAAVKENLTDIQQLDALEAVYSYGEDSSKTMRVEYLGPSPGTRLLICVRPEKTPSPEDVESSSEEGSFVRQISLEDTLDEEEKPSS